MCYFNADNCKNSNENADKGRIRYVTQTIVLNEWCVELIFFFLITFHGVCPEMIMLSVATYHLA